MTIVSPVQSVSMILPGFVSYAHRCLIDSSPSAILLTVLRVLIWCFAFNIAAIAVFIMQKEEINTVLCKFTMYIPIILFGADGYRSMLYRKHIVYSSELITDSSSGQDNPISFTFLSTLPMV